MMVVYIRQRMIAGALFFLHMHILMILPAACYGGGIMHHPVLLEAIEPRAVHARLHNDALPCKFDVGASRHVGATLERRRELVRAMVGFKLIAVGIPFREAGGVSG